MSNIVLVNLHGQPITDFRPYIGQNVFDHYGNVYVVGNDLSVRRVNSGATTGSRHQTTNPYAHQQRNPYTQQVHGYGNNPYINASHQTSNPYASNNGNPYINNNVNSFNNNYGQDDHSPDLAGITTSSTNTDNYINYDTPEPEHKYDTKENIEKKELKVGIDENSQITSYKSLDVLKDLLSQPLKNGHIKDENDYTLSAIKKKIETHTGNFKDVVLKEIKDKYRSSITMYSSFLPFNFKSTVFKTFIDKDRYELVLSEIKGALGNKFTMIDVTIEDLGLIRDFLNLYKEIFVTEARKVTIFNIYEDLNTALLNAKIMMQKKDLPVSKKEILKDFIKDFSRRLDIYAEAANEDINLLIKTDEKDDYYELIMRVFYKTTILKVTEIPEEVINFYSEDFIELDVNIDNIYQESDLFVITDGVRIKVLNISKDIHENKYYVKTFNHSEL